MSFCAGVFVVVVAAAAVEVAVVDGVMQITTKGTMC